MQLYENAWKLIVKPNKIKISSRCYGPKQRVIDGCKVTREDFSYKNRFNQIISGVIFQSFDIIITQYILYLHGNGGSTLDVLPLVDLIPESKIGVIALDLNGYTTQQYLTYGVNEAYYIRDALHFLKDQFNIEKTILWGRSMGAACAITFAEKYQNEVNGLILDAPFEDLAVVIQRTASRQTKIPSPILSAFLFFVKKKAVQQCGQNIFSLNYLEIFGRIKKKIPTLFIFSNFDGIVTTEEVLKFYNICKAPKDLVEIFVQHDADRPQKLYYDCLQWINKCKAINYQAINRARQITCNIQSSLC